MAPADDGGLFGWRHWTIPDSWTMVELDRKPRSPTSGAYGVEGDPTGGEWGKNTQSLGEAITRPVGDHWNPVRHPQLTIADALLRVHSPAIKTFATDMFAHVVSAQSGICGDFELKALECIEYYGSKQAITACKDWYDDFLECQTSTKQRLRLRAMFKKRHIDNHLEYLQGKRTWDETYEKPPQYNAFVEPWFDEKYSHMEHPQH